MAKGSEETTNAQRHTLFLFLTSPAFVVFVISSLLMSFNLAFTYRLRPFNSDDVFWQAILQSWHPFSGKTVTLGNSSVYVDKLPFYEFFQNYFAPSRKVLFAEAGISAVLGFTLFYWSCTYFLKKAGAKLNYITLSPFLWMASFGYSFSELFLNPNWRGFQIGISFALFALVAAISFKDIVIKSSWSKFLLLVVAAYMGLQIYSDPYFLYFTIGPIAILSAVLFFARKLNSRQFTPIVTGLILSLGFSKLFELLFYQAGVRTTISYPMQFIHFENIPASFGGSVHSILIIFGADFFGLEFNKLATKILLLNFALLCYVLYRAFSYLSQTRQQSWQSFTINQSLRIFFVGICLFIFLTNTFSTLGIGTITYRYFLLFVLLMILIFSLSISALKNKYYRYLLAAMLIAATLLNIAMTVVLKPDYQRFEVADNRANTLNYAFIDILKNKGYDKGYANYWDANISTYLADNKVSFLPSVCNGTKPIKWHWLINDDAFNKNSSRSFYIVNPDTPAACTQKTLAKLFGNPIEKVKIGDKTILLYNYDISSKMKVGS
jgi:hypothetical protein